MVVFLRRCARGQLSVILCLLNNRVILKHSTGMNFRAVLSFLVTGNETFSRREEFFPKGVKTWNFLSNLRSFIDPLVALFCLFLKQDITVHPRVL